RHRRHREVDEDGLSWELIVSKTLEQQFANFTAALDGLLDAAADQMVKPTASVAPPAATPDQSPGNPEHSVPGGFARRVIETVAERGSSYGTPAENHQTTADMLSQWLSRRLKMPIQLSAEDVCAINIIQKVSRAAY